MTRHSNSSNHTVMASFFQGVKNFFFGKVLLACKSAPHQPSAAMQAIADAYASTACPDADAATCMCRLKRRSRRSSTQQDSRGNQGTSGPEAAANTRDSSQSCRMQDTQQTVVCRCEKLSMSCSCQPCCTLLRSSAQLHNVHSRTQ